jgi:hypothetical protein
MKNQFLHLVLCCSFSPSLTSLDLGVAHCVSLAHSLCAGSCPVLLILSTSPIVFFLLALHSSVCAQKLAEAYSFSPCWFTTDSVSARCFPGPRADMWFPLSDSSSCVSLGAAHISVDLISQSSIGFPLVKILILNFAAQVLAPKFHGSRLNIFLSALSYRVYLPAHGIVGQLSLLA